MSRPNRTIHRITLLAALLTAPVAPAPAADPPAPEARTPGLTLHVYEVGPLSRLQYLVPGQTPNHSRVITDLRLQSHADFGGIEDHFVAEAQGFLQIDQPGRYEFALRSDDGSALFINGRSIVDHDGLHGEDDIATGTIDLPAGPHAIELRMFDRRGGQFLNLKWKRPGDVDFEPVPSSALFTQANQVHVTSPGEKKLLALVLNTRPGDGQPLVAPHPAFALSEVHDEAFQPPVGGIDFFPDGRLAVCTWDPRGEVLIIEHPDDPSRRKIRSFAHGLAEPLGLKVVDGKIYVLQKQELTQLIDHDGDGVADEYRCVADGWPVTANFHEFAFGLAYADGYFYANLAVAIDPGGRTTVPQVDHDPSTGVGRGQVIKIDPRTGAVTPAAMGLRTPNGIGIGPGGAVFVTDNQGDWLPCSKLIKLVEGAYYGSHTRPDHAWADRPVTPPIAWLPQGEIGNSPSQPAEILVGPWKGQLVHGDVTHGGLKRTFVEAVEGVEQGCVFRFSQGFNGGVNRIAWAPEGKSLYVGQIGSTGNWGQEGKKRFGLQRLAYTGAAAFEPLAVRLAANGMEIEFTEPLAEGLGWEPTHYRVEQWRYEPTDAYGGPKVDREDLVVRSASVSPDRCRVMLEIEGLKQGHVVYLRIGDVIRAESGRSLWTTEAWYTINRLPKTTLVPAPTPAGRPAAGEGWTTLFDGTSLAAWEPYGSGGGDRSIKGWEVVDGAITRVSGGGDIQTRESFADFELTLEWKVAPGGNSGIFFRVDPTLPAAWHSGPEMQVLDNARHPDGRDPLTGAGACYGLVAPPRDASIGPDRWNLVRIVARGPKVEYWLNNTKTAEFDVESDAWKGLVAASKFKDLPQFSRVRDGRIVLQDHGDRVAYRNIRVRRL